MPVKIVPNKSARSGSVPVKIYTGKVEPAALPQHKKYRSVANGEFSLGGNARCTFGQWGGSWIGNADAELRNSIDCGSGYWLRNERSASFIACPSVT